eukprot:1156561-Pelagomonas_calceolata.AAC.8
MSSSTQFSWMWVGLFVLLVPLVQPLKATAIIKNLVPWSHMLPETHQTYISCLFHLLVEEKTKKRKVYAGQRPRALREGPLTQSGKPDASPEGPLNLD